MGCVEEAFPRRASEKRCSTRRGRLLARVEEAPKLSLLSSARGLDIVFGLDVLLQFFHGYEELGFPVTKLSKVGLIYSLSSTSSILEYGF